MSIFGNVAAPQKDQFTEWSECCSISIEVIIIIIAEHLNEAIVGGLSKFRLVITWQKVHSYYYFVPLIKKKKDLERAPANIRWLISIQINEHLKIRIRLYGNNSINNDIRQRN